MTFDQSSASSLRISVIVAVYNGAATLHQCVDSIAAQTYPNVELIVIDGGSSDATLEIIKANQTHIASWVSEPDNGVYNAWNKGLIRASGDWICFLGADDYFWDATVLARMVPTLATLPHAIRIAYGQVMLLNHEGNELYAIGDPWPAVRDKFRQGMAVPHPGLMHRSSLFVERNGFDESFRISGDYELLLGELLHAEAAFIPDVVVAGMRQGGISSTPQNTLRSLMEVRRAQRQHGLSSPGMGWIFAFMRVYVRMALWHILGERYARCVLDLGRRLRGLPPYWTQTR